MTVVSFRPTVLVDEGSGRDVGGIGAYLAGSISDCELKEIAYRSWRSPVVMAEAIGKVEDHVYRDRSFARAIVLWKQSIWVSYHPFPIIKLGSHRAI